MMKREFSIYIYRFIRYIDVMSMPIKWYDIVWIIVWIVLSAFLGTLSFGLLAEGFLNTGRMFAWIFAAILIIPPILRFISVIIARRKITKGGGSFG
jgi:ABC-type sugar transport system permease subunit